MANEDTHRNLSLPKNLVGVLFSSLFSSIPVDAREDPL